MHGDLTFTATGAPCVTFEFDRDAVTLVPEWQGELEVTVKKYRKKRSKDANAYCWVLCDKIAAALTKPGTVMRKEEVYREAIRDIPGNKEAICLRDTAVEKFRELWNKNGIGWLTEEIDSKIEGCTTLWLYYGSSTYDSRQMSILIDRLVEEAKQLGIETATPAELARYKEEWK